MSEVVAIAGGSTGIGRCTAEKFHDEGYNVYVGARRENKHGDKPVSECLENVYYLNLDVTSEESVKSFFKQVYDAEGRLDYFVNSAGICMTGSVESMSYEKHKQLIETNLNGTFLCVKHALKHMKGRNHGAVINISSRGALDNVANFGSYNASKRGVNSLTLTVSQEVEDFNINLCSICPGLVATHEYSPKEGVAPEKVAEKIFEKKDTDGEIIEV